MATSYSTVFKYFLKKINEYNFVGENNAIIEDDLTSYLNLCCYEFEKVCEEDIADRDDVNQTFNVELTFEDIDIITEGMIYKWLSPYIYNSDNLESLLNTKDWEQFSPANLLKEVRATFDAVKKRYDAMIIQYTYDHGNLGDLHL